MGVTRAPNPADTWKYRAYVVPVLGKPIAHGDLGAVLSEVGRLLRDHPGYTVAIRSVSHGRVESSHSILVSRSLTGVYRVEDRPANGRPTDTRRMVADLAEVRTVLTNLGHPIHQDQEF